MSETLKTFIFVILAVVLAAAVYVSRPAVVEFKSEEMIGKQLFPKFTDPLAVKTLEIVQIDASGEKADFKIAEIGGVWSIPSHDNYPADAKDQMAKTAEALTGLTVLDVVTQNDGGNDTAALQAMYGVIDPADNAGDSAGMKIALGAANNEQLVNLIIGKKVTSKADGTAPDESAGKELHYVRVPGQQPVYVMEIDPSRFPADFDRWIEKNLLDISTLDIKQIFVDEYSFKIEVGLSDGGLQETLAPEFKGDMTFDYNASETGAAKWKPGKMMGFKGQNYQYYERKVEADKELNTETLDAAVSALNDLKIVSVLRKPGELAKSLREGKAFGKIKADADASMKKTGFYLVGIPDLKGDKTKTKLQLLSNEGDIQLRMKDGIRYNLRFGDLTGTESEIKEDAAKQPEEGQPDGSKTAEEKKTLGANRYLFITADFDASAIPVPEVKKIPEMPEVPKDTKPEDAEKLQMGIQKEIEAVEKENKREEERYKADIEAGKKRAERLSARFADWYYVIPEDVYKKIHLTEANVFRTKPKNEVPPPENKPDGEQEKPAENKADNLPDLPGIEQVIP
ncbi:MAG: DUF4340 domain-containing protein [Planctomycetaceae bacterium]|jgi:hypothetical protein|nr:DUF4340 domain-containing protein [Planctomycetaceae bacterium]